MLFLIPIAIFLFSNLIWLVPILLAFSLVSSIAKRSYRGVRGVLGVNDPNEIIEEERPLSSCFSIKVLSWFGGFGYKITKTILRRVCRASPALSHVVDRSFDYASKNGIHNVGDVVEGVKTVAQTSANHVMCSYAAKAGVASEQARQGIHSATDKFANFASKAQDKAKNVIANPQEATQSIGQSIKNFFGRLFADNSNNGENTDLLNHDNIESHPIKALSNGFNNTRRFISQAFGTTKHTVGRAAKRLEQTVENGINNTAELKNSVSAWKSIDWNTGNGILPAIQATAEGCASGFGLLKKLPGGKYLSSRDFRAASFVAAKFFPPAAIAMEAGRVVLNTGGRISDVTDITKKIYNHVIARHYLRAAYGAFELFKIMAFNSGARRPVVE